MKTDSQAESEATDTASLPTRISPEEIKEIIKTKNLKTMRDVNQFVKELVAPTIQAMLEAEMSNHLGYEKHEAKGRNSGNSRNGYSAKTLKGNFGQETIQIPRDRNGAFDPIAVRKYETIDNDIEEKIISMYAKGLTTRDLQAHMQDIYGVDVSPTMISHITDKVFPLVQEWQSRPLSPHYPFLYLDGLHFKVRDGGRIVVKCAYVVFGINMEGNKEILGIWIGNHESARFWLGVLTELQNRGVQDIIIASVDGLEGFTEAIKTVFPKTDIQQCIVHQIRNTMKYVPNKYRDAFCKDLRMVYTAPTEEAGFAALQSMKEQWPDYAIYVKSWEEKWHVISPFFRYPSLVRKMMYTTNAIENLHRQLRKVTKTTTIFPHEEALMKLLWLAQHDITKRWTIPIPNWGTIIAQLAMMYLDRIVLN